MFKVNALGVSEVLHLIHICRLVPLLAVFASVEMHFVQNKTLLRNSPVGGGGTWVVTGGGGPWVVTGGGGPWVVTGGTVLVRPPSSLNAYSEYR